MDCCTVCTGIVHLLISLAMIACGVVLIIWDNTYQGLYSGIWGGIWVLTTGIVGVIGGVQRSQLVLKASVVLNVVTATVLTSSLFIINILLLENYENQNITLAHLSYKANHNRPPGVSHSICIVLVFIGALLIMSTITSAAFAYSLVDHCCGATHKKKINKIEPIVKPETTAITYKCVNNQSIDHHQITNQSISVQPDQFGQHLSPQQLGQQPNFQPHYQQFTSQPNLHNPTNYSQQPMFQVQQPLSTSLNPILQPTNLTAIDQQQSILPHNQLYPKLYSPPPQGISP